MDILTNILTIGVFSTPVIATAIHIYYHDSNDEYAYETDFFCLRTNREEEEREERERAEKESQTQNPKVKEFPKVRNPRSGQQPIGGYSSKPERIHDKGYGAVMSSNQPQGYGYGGYASTTAPYTQTNTGYASVSNNYQQRKPEPAVTKRVIDFNTVKTQRNQGYQQKFNRPDNFGYGGSDNNVPYNKTFSNENDGYGRTTSNRNRSEVLTGNLGGYASTMQTPKKVTNLQQNTYDSANSMDYDDGYGSTPYFNKELNTSNSMTEEESLLGYSFTDSKGYASNIQVKRKVIG